MKLRTLNSLNLHQSTRPNPMQDSPMQNSPMQNSPMQNSPMSSRPTHSTLATAGRRLVAALALLAFVLPPAMAEAKHPKARRGRAKAARHQPQTGGAYWIHREGDKPLGWLFGRHLNAARKKGQSVVVMFTADWCSPCKAIKEFVAGSTVVRRAFRKHHGRLLYIDVDEWRGPAHRLIPGVYPQKLPTLVRIDRGGRRVQVAYGSSLGLLSEDAVALNFGRLFDAKPLITPAYQSNSAKQTELIRAQHDAREARNRKVTEVVVTRMKGGKVRLQIRNLEGPRRWYLVPVKGAAKLAEQPKVSSVSTVRFQEHVRANYLRFDGPQPFIAIPVAGYGDVDLTGWPLTGLGKTLEIWQLNRLDIGGSPRQFDRKLPYHQTMKKAGSTFVQGTQPVQSVRAFIKRKITARVH